MTEAEESVLSTSGWKRGNVDGHAMTGTTTNQLSLMKLKKPYKLGVERN